MELRQVQVLRTDASGMPLEWIGYQETAKLYYLAWSPTHAVRRC